MVDIRLKMDKPTVERSAPDLHAVKRAATIGALRTGQKGKSDLRRQLGRFKSTPAFAKSKGQNIKQALSVVAFPSKYPSSQTDAVALDPAVVFFVRPKFMPIFTTGGTITAHGGYLAFALPAAVRLGLDRMTFDGRFRKRANIKAAERQFGKLRMLRSPGAQWSILAADPRSGALGARRFGKRKENLVPLFLLTRAVDAPKMFDYQGPVKRATDNYPAEAEKAYRPPKKQSPGAR